MGLILYLRFPFNPEEWLASNFSLQYPPWLLNEFSSSAPQEI